MQDDQFWAERFERQRPRLQALAYRMLGSRHRAPGLQSRYAIVNGGPGVVATIDGRVTAVLACTVANGLIVEVDILTDPRRLGVLNLGVNRPP